MHPKFMCRPGTVEQAWGVWIEPGRAETEEEEAEMVANGWFASPLDFAPPAPAPTRKAKAAPEPVVEPEVALDLAPVADPAQG